MSFDQSVQEIFHIDVSLLSWLLRFDQTLLLILLANHITIAEGNSSKELVIFYEQNMLILILIFMFVEDGHHASDEWWPNVIGCEWIPKRMRMMVMMVFMLFIMLLFRFFQTLALVFSVFHELITVDFKKSE